MLLCDVCNKPLDTSTILKPCFHRVHQKCATKACETCTRIKWGNEVGIYWSFALLGVLCMILIGLQAFSMQDEYRQDVNDIHTYMEKIKGLAQNDIRARESLLRFKETAHAMVYALTRDDDLKMTDKIYRLQKQVEMIH